MSVKVPSLTEIYEKYNKIIENEESILKNEFIQTFKNKYGRIPTHDENNDHLELSTISIA